MSNARGSTIPDRADIIDKIHSEQSFPRHRKNDHQWEPTRKESQNVGRRSTHGVIGLRWIRCEEVRCVGMGREVDLSFVLL